MKLEFIGWNRTILKHKHTIKPVTESKKGYYPTSKGPLVWQEAMRVLGKIEATSLTGDYLVTFSLEDSELKSWLLAYAKSAPEETLKLIAEAQAEALIALATKPVIDSDSKASENA